MHRSVMHAEACLNRSDSICGISLSIMRKCPQQTSLFEDGSKVTFRKCWNSNFKSLSEVEIGLSVLVEFLRPYCRSVGSPQAGLALSSKICLNVRMRLLFCCKANHIPKAVLV